MSKVKDGPLSHKEIMVVLSGLMTGMLLAALDQTIVSTALKNIVEDFNGLNHYTWVVTAYLLTSTASTPLYGKISDLYGRRPVFQFAIITFLIGSFLAGASQNMTQLIFTRALQGLGAGGLMALTFVIIGDIVSPRERGKYQGLIDRCSPVWRLSASESGERADWLRRSADAGFVPAMLDAATDMGIEQSLEQRNARIQQALESRTAYVASAVAVSLYLDHVVPNGNLLDSLLYVQPAAMRGLRAGCELGDDCSMDSAAANTYCQQFACPPEIGRASCRERVSSPV